MDENSEERLWTPWEVARLFRVEPKTVAQWERRGKIKCVRTPGGHRRYLESEVLALAATRSGNSS